MQFWCQSMAYNQKSEGIAIDKGLFPEHGASKTAGYFKNRFALTQQPQVAARLLGPAEELGCAGYGGDKGLP